MAIATGTLTRNQVKSWMYNQIISIMTFIDNVGTDFDELVNKFRVDGSKYGDKKQYISLELPKVSDFVMDSEEALNVLKTHRTQGKLEEITLDTFKRVALTSDSYITPLAFGNEGAFAQYNSALLATMREAKKVYDSLTFDVALGCAKSSIGDQTRTITFTTVSGDTEATNRLHAQAIAKELADIQVALKYPSTKYNDFGYLRSYNLSDFVIVFNSDELNKIVYMDKPTIYNDGFFSELGKYSMPPEFFGTIKTTGGTVGASDNLYAYKQKEYTISGQAVEVRPGEKLPVGAAYEAGDAYTVDANVLFKVVHKDALPFMSALELGTQFVNAGNANSTNSYLFWGHNTPERIKGVPLITVRSAS